MLQEAVDDYITSLSAKDVEGTGSGGITGNNKNTIMAYRNDLRQLSMYLSLQGIGSWQETTSEHIASYLQEMRTQRAYRPTTITRKLAAFKSFFRYLQSNGVIAQNPAEKLEAPRVQKELPQILNIEQINALFRQVEKETSGGQRDLAMLHVLSTTGMRVSEIISLNLSDFDAEHAIIRYLGRDGQERRQRELPLSPLATASLQGYVQSARPYFIRNAEEQALFLNHHGERLTRQGFWLIIKGYARAAGIAEITPHMVRHSFAILMLRKEMERCSVQELLGYANITVQMYNHIACPYIHEET